MEGSMSKPEKPMRQARLEASLGPVWVWVEDGLDARAVERILYCMNTRDLVECMGDMDVTVALERVPKGEEVSGAIVRSREWIHEDDLDVIPIPMPPTAAELEALGQVPLPLEPPK